LKLKASDRSSGFSPFQGFSHHHGKRITKSLAYRYLFLIPKGLTQAGKTVLGPFTHGRNFTSGAVTTIQQEIFLFLQQN